MIVTPTTHNDHLRVGVSGIRLEKLIITFSNYEYFPSKFESPKIIFWGFHTVLLVFGRPPGRLP